MSSFTKKQRLLVKAQFDNVFKQAQKVFFKEFLVLFRTNDTGMARLGFAVSKKSIAKANGRNRCKRLVRESFRHTTLPNVDIVFISRHGFEHLSNSVVNQKLTQAWQKLSGIQEKLSSHP